MIHRIMLLAIAALPALAAPAEKEKFHLYLLAGQSNMAGRGAVEEQDKTPHPRIFVLNKQDEWAPAREPLHFDKSAAGVGPGFAFAKAMAEAQPQVTIGLIPCAVGGSPIASWQPGATDAATKTTPYDTAIRRAKLAMKDGTLKGILWHQGESDSSQKNAAAYGGTLEKTLARFRDDLGVDDLPIVVGGLGDHTLAKNENAKVVQEALKNLPKRLANAAFASSEGLKHKGDNTHFDSPGARELGKRMAEQMLRLQKLPKPQAIRLWPDGLPDGKPLDKPEEKRGARLARVSDPAISVYVAEPEKATGAAVVVCPGGGYGRLAIEKEGDCIARWLNELGITAAVLKYRLKEYPQPAPLVDAQQAVRLVRLGAAQWKVDPAKIGVMGFSAGGHLAAAVSNAQPIPLSQPAYAKYNAIECRPAFSILVYGVLPQSGDKWVKEMYTAIDLSPQTPPAFLVHAKDDGIPCQLSADYAAACQKHNVPAELHLYDQGGHGYGLGQNGGEVAQWPSQCAKWLASRGLGRSN